MNKISLKYFSGTGNSLRVLDICNTYFKESAYKTMLSSIIEKNKKNKNNKKDDFKDIDIIGFSFPVYAFSLPRIAMRYLKSLPKSKNKTKVFLLVTAGAFDESGFALRKGKKILEKKGYNVIYSEVIEMPSNWTTFDKPLAKDLADKIIKKGEEKANKIAENILNTEIFHHKFNTPKRMGYFKMFLEYFLFHYMGIYQMWKLFRTDSLCNSCGLCEKICPTKSIALKTGKPKWNSSCEQCMRCVNFCPKQAIFQTNGGDTKGKNRYYEPHFKPLSKKNDEI